MTLPLAEEQERAAVPPVASTSAAAAALPILDILLVEDGDDARSGLELLLAETGSCVRAVESVRAALREYDDHAPDVVVSDIGMPDEDGYALIQAIRERDERRSRRTLGARDDGIREPARSGDGTASRIRQARGEADRARRVARAAPCA